MVKVIIDRIEGDYAIVELEDGTIIETKKELFEDIEEGDIYYIKKDMEAKHERVEEIASLFERLKRKNR